MYAVVWRQLPRAAATAVGDCAEAAHGSMTASARTIEERFMEGADERGAGGFQGGGGGGGGGRRPAKWIGFGYGPPPHERQHFRDAIPSPLFTARLSRRRCAARRATTAAVSRRDAAGRRARARSVRP